MITRSIFKRLRNLEKSGEGDAVDSSSVSRLPDEIILQIFSRLSDLKTLCFCYLVSKRFSSIVLEVDAISFTAPLLNPLIVDKNSVDDVAPSKPIPPILSEYFLSATRFLDKFRGVKSFCMELPSSRHTAIDNRYLFRWKVKFGSRVESVIFLSPNTVCDNDGFYLHGNGDEEENRESVGDMLRQKFETSLKYVNDVVTLHMALLCFVLGLPNLEKVSITDSGKTGRLSLSGEKLNEVKDWVNSVSESERNLGQNPDFVSIGFIPVLKLPVSGFVMKRIFFALVEMKDLQGRFDGLMKSEDGLEDKEDVVYSEAVKEILEKHRDMIHPIGSLL